MVVFRITLLKREMGMVSRLVLCFAALCLIAGCETLDGPAAATSVAVLATQIASGEIEGLESEPDAQPASAATAVATLPADLPEDVEEPDLLATASPTADVSVELQPSPESDAFALSSPAFSDGGTIPTIYTCDGQDISPALEWRWVPPGTESLALICDDPDAPGGTWVHWVIYDIPVTVSSLPEGISRAPNLADGSRQGRNSWSRSGYSGPCPPSGAHRYHFRLYALDAFLGLAPDLTDKQALLDAVADHVLGEATLVGEYQR